MSRLGWERIEAALASRPPARVTDPVDARAAVALILREAEAGLEILFIRRAEHPQDPWSGQMAFPGGRAEPGEDLEATAIRETVEEIGVRLDADALCLGILDEVRAMARMRPVSMTILPFVFRLRGPVEPTLGSECAASTGSRSTTCWRRSGGRSWSTRTRARPSSSPACGWGSGGPRSRVRVRPRKPPGTRWRPKDGSE